MGRIEDAHMIVLHMIGYYFMILRLQPTEHITPVRKTASAEVCWR
jgi:hypothetical protein